MRTVASYTTWKNSRSPYEQARGHAEDLRSIGFKASVSERTRKDGTTVYTVRSNIPRGDWRA